ncbi:MAG: hypothetical protein DWQ01_21670 [Planctomycetota bacterium]|nr:MAG: hypothetical protein DWQ01_21670 [Planctomycetota bacterium]
MKTPALLFLTLLAAPACSPKATDSSQTPAEDAPSSSQAGKDSASETAKVLEPFTQSVPGTTAELEMVPIAAGKFTAESGEVTDLPAFWISKTEITWDLYDVWYLELDLPPEKRSPDKDARSRPSKPYGAPDRGFGHEGYPALGMPAYAARKFARWLSALTGRNYRLPTEAEWTYVCQQGLDPDISLEDQAWFFDNAMDSTHPVAKKAVNRLGLYDMLGNVAEWCTTADGEDLACGGCYDSDGKDVHPLARMRRTPEWSLRDPQNPKSKWWLSDGPYVGIRLICEP